MPREDGERRADRAVGARRVLPVTSRRCRWMYNVGYTPVVYSLQTTHVFEAWFDGPRDRYARARIQVRIDRAEDGNFGDCKPVGEGVSEKA